MADPIFSHPLAWRETGAWLDRVCATGGAERRLGWHSVAFIMGSSGVGKSFMAHRLCKDRNYEVALLHTQNCDNAKAMRDQLVKAASTQLVAQLSSNIRQKVIILDEMDCLMNIDRMVFPTLVDLFSGNLPIPHTPCIVIGSMTLERKLAATARAAGKSTAITMYPPTEADIFLFLKWLVSQDDMIEGSRPSVELLMSIAESSEGNLQYAKQQLQMLMVRRDNQGEEGRVGIQDVGSRRDIHATFKSIYDSNQSISQVLSIIDDDPWLNPLRLHENLIKEINNRKGVWKSKYDTYEKILEAMIIWDQHMSSAVGGGTSGAGGAGAAGGVGGGNEMSGGSIDGAFGTDHLARTFCHFIGKLDKKKKMVDTNLQDFTKLFSQMSLHKKQEKALFHDSKDFPWADAHFF